MNQGNNWFPLLHLYSSFLWESFLVDDSVTRGDLVWIDQTIVSRFIIAKSMPFYYTLYKLCTVTHVSKIVNAKSIQCGSSTSRKKVVNGLGKQITIHIKNTDTWRKLFLTKIFREIKGSIYFIERKKYFVYLHVCIYFLGMYYQYHFVILYFTCTRKSSISFEKKTGLKKNTNWKSFILSPKVTG